MQHDKQHHIVIAVDGSDNSRRAVAYVGEFLSGQKGFTLTLLHVIHMADEDFFPSPPERGRWIRSERKKIARWMSVYQQMLIDRGLSPQDVQIRIVEQTGPSLARLILFEMARLDAGTIVVGRQGVSRKEEFLFGSVSKQIVSHARTFTVWVVGPQQK